MSRMNFMIITASPELATFFEQYGVARIFMDQEVMGKTDRQGHLDTHKAAHSLKEIEAVASVLKESELMVRLNPLHSKTLQEIDAALYHGAQRLMLPMFTSRQEVACFLDMVNGRVPVSFLLETPQALVRLSDWIPLLTAGYDEIHVGLNDLSLGMKLDFLFEPLAARMLDPASELLNKNGITWGVGGIARIGHGELPADVILGEHVRLGSQWVILSRAFHGGAASPESLMEKLDFSDELANIRNAVDYWQQASLDELDRNQQLLASIVYRHIS